MTSKHDASATTLAEVGKITPWLFLAAGLLFILAGAYPVLSRVLGSANSDDVNPAFIAIGGAFAALGGAFFAISAAQTAPRALSGEAPPSGHSANEGDR